MHQVWQPELLSDYFLPMLNLALQFYRCNSLFGSLSVPLFHFDAFESIQKESHRHPNAFLVARFHFSCEHRNCFNAGEFATKEFENMGQKVCDFTGWSVKRRSDRKLQNLTDGQSVILKKFQTMPRTTSGAKCSIPSRLFAPASFQCTLQSVRNWALGEFTSGRSVLLHRHADRCMSFHLQ